MRRCALTLREGIICEAVGETKKNSETVRVPRLLVDRNYFAMTSTSYAAEQEVWWKD